MTRHKYCGDGKEVVSKLPGVICLFIFTVNHELRASLFEDKLQELDSISTQAVFVHDHNFSHHSLEDSFQKGEQTFALKVEA